MCKLPSAQKVEPKTEEDIIPDKGIEELNADLANYNNIEEVEDKQIKNETVRGKEPCIEQHEMQRTESRPTLKRKNNNANEVNEDPAAVSNGKKAGCQMLVAVDVH